LKARKTEALGCIGLYGHIKRKVFNYARYFKELSEGGYIQKPLSSCPHTRQFCRIESPHPLGHPVTAAVLWNTIKEPLRSSHFLNSTLMKTVSFIPYPYLSRTEFTVPLLFKQKRDCEACPRDPVGSSAILDTVPVGTRSPIPWSSNLSFAPALRQEEMCVRGKQFYRFTTVYFKKHHGKEWCILIHYKYSLTHSYLNVYTCLGSNYKTGPAFVFCCIDI
jgi:hypothetical protein